IAIRTLLISAIIMEVILIAYSRGIVAQFFDSEALNTELPFLPVLIFSPVMLCISLIYRLLGRKSGVYQKCAVMFGSPIERGFIGHIVDEENRYQISATMTMGIVATALSVFYYFVFYINVNINSADAFFLCWFPFIGYLLVAVFMGTRYISLWGYYAQDIEGSNTRIGEKTWMRYLVMCDDTIYLAHNEDFFDIPGMDKIDTPASLNVPYREKVKKDYAGEVFSHLCSIKEDQFLLRFMYLSKEAEGLSNIFHYIVTVKKPETISDSALKGKWYTISQLQRLIYNRDIAPILAAEINRLYTVAMAWKTYDRDGNRLYKIKNYRPLFRFSGIDDWEVDFNDPHWLRVARFNEDKPFFRLRRWIKRLTGDY
ncbi:MAG: hypothetical protein K2H98_00010, partial [Duncaniella sp.]|nr:hypothetical protein [Duncaniella sp.]